MSTPENKREVSHFGVILRKKEILRLVTICFFRLVSEILLTKLEKYIFEIVELILEQTVT